MRRAGFPRQRAYRASVWFAALLAAAPVPAAEPLATSGVIPLELWDRPRSGRAVLAVPAMREALAGLAARPQARVVIRHPAGAEGMLQAEELRSWLIAHAVEPRRVELRAEAAARQPLQLELVP